MAILLVKVLDENSLPLNEFFDYKGYCYCNYPVNILDFYEASENTKTLSDIMVVFTDTEGKKIIGWYLKADVFSESKLISPFLEGNIKAAASDVVLLETACELIWDTWSQNEKLLTKQCEVIECEDCRYDTIINFVTRNNHKNVFMRYPFVQIETDQRSRKSIELTRQYCQLLAGNIMDDNCNGIMDIKALEKYSKQLIRLSHKDSDGYYYNSMACYQLGFVKDAMKSIEKAIQLDGEEADFIAQKANILCSMKYFDKAQELYAKAYEMDKEPLYKIYQGRALMFMGQMEKAYNVFGEIEDKALLEECGITTKIESMDKKWSFSKILKRLKREQI